MGRRRQGELSAPAKPVDCWSRECDRDQCSQVPRRSLSKGCADTHRGDLVAVGLGGCVNEVLSHRALERPQESGSKRRSGKVRVLGAQEAQHSVGCGDAAGAVIAEEALCLRGAAPAAWTWTSTLDSSPGGLENLSRRQSLSSDHRSQTLCK